MFLTRSRIFIPVLLFKRTVLKLHVNEGGLVVATLEVHPDKSSSIFENLLGGLRRELYVINSYRSVADLRRCSGYQVNLDADRVQLYDKTLSGSLRGYYEPARQCLRVSGELIRRRAATGLLSESETRIQLDNVCLKYVGNR